MASHVFISYSRTDAIVMKQVYDSLEQAGLPVWYDKRIKSGTPNWKQAIDNALREAKAFVLLCSPDAVKSKYVAEEIAGAELYEVPIFTVWLRGSEADAIPFGVRSVQRVDIRDQTNYEAEIQRLVDGIRQVIPAGETTDAQRPSPAPSILEVSEQKVSDIQDNPHRNRLMIALGLLVAAAVVVVAVVLLMNQNSWSLASTASQQLTALAAVNEPSEGQTSLTEVGVSTTAAPTSEQILVPTQAPTQIAPVTRFPVSAANTQSPETLNAESNRLFPAGLPDCAEAGDNADAARGDVNLYFDQGQHERALGCARRVYELQGEQAFSDQQRLIELGQCQNPTAEGGLGGKNFLDRYMALSNVGNSFYVAGKSYRALNNPVQAAAVWDAIIQQFNCAWVGDGVTMWSPAAEAEKRLVLLTPTSP